MTKVVAVKPISMGRAGILISLILLSNLANAIVLHTDTQPADRPPDGYVGKWLENESTKASCIVIGKRYILTTKHQGGGAGYTVVLNNQNYIVDQIQDIDSDIRIARVKKLNTGLVNIGLTEYPVISTKNRYQSQNQEIRIGGFGKIRGAEKKIGDTVYGYSWAENSSLSLKWCSNKINTNDGTVLLADFDGAAAYDYVVSEGAVADHDSGSGWFIKNSTTNKWDIIGLTFGVDPCTPLGESRFLDPGDITNPDPTIYDRFYAWWLNSYITTINTAITEPFIPNLTTGYPGSGCGEIILGWTAVSSVDGYRIYYSSTDSSNLMLYGSVASSATTKTLTGLDPAQNYFIAITSYKGIAESDYSNIINVNASNICPHIISGIVSDNGLLLSNVLISLDGGLSDTTDSEGRFDISVPYGWTGTLTPSKAYYEFIPITITEPVTSDIINFNIEPERKDISEDFNDIRRSAKWFRHIDGNNIMIDQPDGLLDITCDSNDGFGTAEYIANEWTISPNANFAFKVQFHNELVTDVNSGLFVRLDVNDVNYIIADITSKNQQKSYLFDSDIFSQLPVTRDTNDGYLYFSYNSDINEVYISISDYGLSSLDYFVQIPDKKHFKLQLGGYTQSGQIPPDKMWFDNFIVNSGIIENYPPKTDIDKSGYIDVNDLAVFSTYWLSSDPNADFYPDSIVDFKDFTKLSQVW